MTTAVNLSEKLVMIEQHWSPRIVGELNDSYVKLAKLEGEFMWHQHDAEDELFVVLKGELLMKFRDHETWVREGEILVVPKGVEHLPVAPAEVHVMLLEPKTTVNTGEIRNDRTVADQWL